MNGRSHQELLQAGVVPAQIRIPNREVVPEFLQPMFEAVETGAPIEPVLGNIAHELGFSSFLYKGNIASPAVVRDFYGWTNVSVAWTRRYAARHYRKIDPRVTRARVGELPLVWDQQSERGASGAVDAFLDDALAHGIGSGIVIPFLAPLGAPASFTLNSPEPVIPATLQQEWQAKMGDLYLFGIVIHALYVAAVVENPSQPAALGQAVSQLEARALLQVAGGDSHEEVAGAMGVSRTEVGRWLRAVCVKLGAKTTEEAIRIALTAGPPRG